MRRISYVLLVLLILLTDWARSVADDSLKAREASWIRTLLEQIPRVSESQQRTAIAMTVSVLADTGHEAEAKTIALRQTDEDTKNSLLTSIATSLAQKSLFDSAFAAVDAIAEPRWKERATHFVGIALARKGELGRAEALIRQMSDDYHKDCVLGGICEYLARDGKIDEAFTRAREISDAYRKSESIKAIERLRDGTPSPLEQLSGSLRDRIRTMTAFSSEGTYDAAILAIVAAKNGDRNGVEKHIGDAIGESKTRGIPPKKIPTAILAAVAYVELEEKDEAGNMVERLYGSVGQDWSGLSTAFGSPILISLLVHLERFDAIDEILLRKREVFQTDPAESLYFFTLESVGESLVEQGHLAEFESRLDQAKTPEEKLYLLMGAIIGSDYARRTKP
ncbi:hypothetical protein SH501x_001896 [Pirellulaceae bacterium SH501]